MAGDQSTIDTTQGGTNTNPAQTVAEGKGKGKAVDTAPHDVSMDEDEDSSDEETGAEDEACFFFANALISSDTDYMANTPQSQQPEAPEEEEEDEDNMEEINTDNIISDGRRTRGKAIDFVEAAKNAGDELDDDDEDDDDDFEEREDDAMQE